MQALAVTQREFESALARGQDQDVSSGVHDRRAEFAVVKMYLYVRQYLGIERSIQLAGDVFPNELAFYNHGNHLHL